MGALFSTPTWTQAQVKRADENMVIPRTGRKDETGAKYHGNWRSEVTSAVDATVPVRPGQGEFTANKANTKHIDHTVAQALHHIDKTNELKGERVRLWHSPGPRLILESIHK